MKFSVSKNNNRRVQVSPARQATMRPNDDVEIAVDVAAPQYVPAGVKLRARMSDQLFTAVTKAANLAQLEDDPNVNSVQVGRTLRLP